MKGKNRSLSDLRKINVLHETLHLFGLRHSDGGVMSTGANGAHNFRVANTQSEYLLTSHIQKVQAKSFPSW
jgi:hypothetical protein